VSARPVDPKLPLGGDPRVQLLPQSVRDRAKSAAVRRRLAMLVVLAIVVVGGGYGYAFMRNLTAQQQLQTARQATQAVLEEQAEYAEGTRAASLVTGIRTAQTYATGTELLWEPLTMQIAGLMPEGTLIRQISAAAQAPWEPALTVEGPLRQSRLAIVTITFSSPDIISSASIVPKFAELEGYVDARLDSSVWDSTIAQYSSIVRIMLDADAVSDRFTGVSEEDDDTEESDGEQTSDASGIPGGDR
jgi:hypothetical protein